MSMDVTKASERDLKRFDDLTTRFETVGLILGFVNLFLAVWVRAPGLQMDPSLGVGLALGGFNVGYAIVYGPVVAFLSVLFSVSLLERRDAVRAQILRLGAQTPEALSDGDRVAIGSAVGSNSPFRKADIAWRAFGTYSCLRRRPQWPLFDTLISCRTRLPKRGPIGRARATSCSKQGGGRRGPFFPTTP